ncbi:MAG: FHA domain-containing protein [Coriobacteriales bacterium]|nr:FHA domain-containing protein [Coriobacteriales bacterium]
MKTCMHCGATAFDDMDTCFECLTPFPGSEPYSVFLDEGEFLEEIEEPIDLPPVILPPVRLRVEFPGQFLYDAYLVREEGARLRIGCAADNNVIIPQTEVGRHQLTLCYAQGQLWLEDHDSTFPALIDGIPLSGTRKVGEGNAIAVGDALLTLLSA